MVFFLAAVLVNSGHVSLTEHCILLQCVHQVPTQLISLLQ